MWPPVRTPRLRLGWGSHRGKTSGSSVNLPWCMDLLRRVRVSTNTCNLLLIWLMLREEREEESASLSSVYLYIMSLWTNASLLVKSSLTVMMISMLEHTFSPLGPDGPCGEKKRPVSYYITSIHQGKRQGAWSRKHQNKRLGRLWQQHPESETALSPVADPNWVQIMWAYRQNMRAAYSFVPRPVLLSEGNSEHPLEAAWRR